MIEQIQGIVHSKHEYPDFDTIPHQLRDSIEAEWICKILNDLQFECEQQHPRMELEKDLFEMKGQWVETKIHLKELPDIEFLLFKEREEKGEWELEVSER